MKNRKPHSVAAALAVSLSVLVATAATPVHVSGEKVDSGLGDLPHYSLWADPSGKAPMQATGEKVDSGLGDLPHYSLWADPSGKTPLQAPSVQVSRSK